MADIDVSSQNQPIQGGTWANTATEVFTFIPAANTTAGDKVLLTKLQEGTKLLDAVAFVEDAVTDLTLSLGYRYPDATDPLGNTLTDDEAFFFSATAVAAGGKFRSAVNKPPVTLQAEAYLVATLGGAAFATTNRLTIMLTYDFTGHK